MSGYPRAVGRFAEAAMESSLPPSRRLIAPQRRRRSVVRLWLPLTPLFLLLAPFPLLLAPLAWLAPPAFRPGNPYAAVLALGRLLLSLGGTVVDVDAPDALVSIRIL
jgi:hypothetical protein